MLRRLTKVTFAGDFLKQQGCDCQYLPRKKLDYLITDWDASEEDLKAFDEQGIEIIIVEE